LNSHIPSSADERLTHPKASNPAQQQMFRIANFIFMSFFAWKPHRCERKKSYRIRRTKQRHGDRRPILASTATPRAGFARQCAGEN
jgi:hypothetical protein